MWTKTEWNVNCESLKLRGNLQSEQNLNKFWSGCPWPHLSFWRQNKVWQQFEQDLNELKRAEESVTRVWTKPKFFLKIRTEHEWSMNEVWHRTYPEQTMNVAWIKFEFLFRLCSGLTFPTSTETFQRSYLPKIPLSYVAIIWSENRFGVKDEYNCVYYC